MKKKVLLISSVFLALSIILVITINNMDNKEKNIISNVEKDKQVINSNMITMMYETDAGTGEYVETKDNTWPESGYIFNDTLSGCENGGELEYNSANNTVNLLSNKSDRCYVYFDKYDGVWIDSVSINNVTGSSVTLDVSATSENGSITKYYYSLNDSEEYQEVTSNVITINDLNKLTEYKISIYAIDSTNAKSNIYELSVSTTDISKPIINSVSVSNITDSGFTLTVNTTSDTHIEKYYFTIAGEGENIAGTNTENSYSFTTLNQNTNYNVVIFVKDLNFNYSEEYKINVQTLRKIIFADYIKSLYTSQGSKGLYYHNGSLANSAGDNNYRYAGANPNNYVCFGSDANNCPTDNLYRIIGVFDGKVKLIKYDYANSNMLGVNGTYDTSTFQTSNYQYYNGNHSVVNRYKSYYEGLGDSELISVNLNNNFFNSLTSSWQNLISTCDWYDGHSSNGDNPLEAYTNEMNGKKHSNKIGLMYLSEYGFAASPTYWENSVNRYDEAKNSNWMYMGLIDVTINYDDKIDTDGGVTGWSTSAGVRPTFFLNSDVEYVSGSGTKTNPYRIK